MKQPNRKTAPPRTDRAKKRKAPTGQINGAEQGNPFGDELRKSNHLQKMEDPPPPNGGGSHT